MKKEEEALISILKQRDKIRRTVNSVKGIAKAKALINRDFSLFHIEELTFEDESPRKEALENVLSTIGMDGISFVYLLLGDMRGVSFYFGIVKDAHYRKQLDLDVNEIGSDILKPSIEGNFRGSKITKVKEKQTVLDCIRSMKRFARIDGVPSVNEENEDFQGVDRLVDVMSGDTFGLMVLADPLSGQEISAIESTLYDIYNKLSPLAKESVQESRSTAVTDGETTGTSESQTQGTSSTHTEGTNKSTSKSTSKSTGDGSDSKSTSDNATTGTNSSKALGENQSTTEGKTYSKQTSVAKTEGINKSREFSDKVVNECGVY